MTSRPNCCLSNSELAISLFQAGFRPNSFELNGRLSGDLKSAVERRPDDNRVLECSQRFLPETIAEILAPWEGPLVEPWSARNRNGTRPALTIFWRSCDVAER